MLFSIVVTLMVLLVAAFWLRQGFFSAVIFFLEAVVASVVAFGFFEAIHSLWAESVPADIGPPLALMLLFLVTLAVLRVLTDKMIPGNVKFPLYIDRAGGGICGFFTGLILVGTPLVAVQMLPIGSTVFGFERLEVNDDGKVDRKSLGLFAPDAFTVGLVEMLSNGRFGSDNPFGIANPDLLWALYSARSSPQPEARLVVPEGCLKVNAYWEAPQIAHVSQRAEGGRLIRDFTLHEPAEVTNTFLVCNVQLDASAAPEGQAAIRFRVPQFRLVGPPPGQAGTAHAKPRVYLACGMSDLYTHKEHGLAAVDEGQSTRLVRFSPLTDFILGPKTTEVVADAHHTYRFDVAFEVPQGFVPWYMEFKKGARVELRKDLYLAAPPEGASTATGRAASKKRAARKSGSTQAPKVGQAPGGRTHVASAVEERTGVTAMLPVALSRKDRKVAGSLRGGKLQECHFWIQTPDEVDPAASVTEFYVPAGKKMVQIGAEQAIPLSLIGRALNYAATVASQIYISTEDGRQYFAQGVYAEAPVGGQRVFEIQYHPEALVPERCLKKPLRLKKTVMTQAPASQRKFGYLFLVDPGVKIVGFHAGRASPQRLNIDVPR